MPAEITTSVSGEPQNRTIVLPGLGARFPVFDAAGKEGLVVVACQPEDYGTDIFIFEAPAPSDDEDLEAFEEYRRSHIVKTHTIGHEAALQVCSDNDGESIEYLIGHVVTMSAS